MMNVTTKLIIWFVLTLRYYSPVTAESYRRCSTKDPTEGDLQTATRVGKKWQYKFKDGETLKRGAPIPVNVTWHVITNAANTEGDLTDADITSSIQVLNNAFSPHFLFTLISSEKTKNDSYFSASLSFARNSNDPEIIMKNDLWNGDAKTLNVYSNNGGGYLGWSSFPSDYANDNSYDGVVIGYSTVPGGSESLYNKGATLTHEVGHWLGLYHTFQYGCSETNDLVADTPAHAGPDYDCIEADTCSSPGGNPIDNFMNYTPDACMVRFTGGQFYRMLSQWAEYRDTDTTAPPNLAPAPTIPPTQPPTTSMAPTQGPLDCNLADEDEMYFLLTTDEYGEETSVTLTNDCDGTVLYSGNGYSSGSKYETQACVPKVSIDSSYTYVINDSFSDGICCNFGEGGYNITIGDEVHTGGSFTSSATYKFGTACLTMLPNPNPATPIVEEPNCFTGSTTAIVRGKGIVTMMDIEVGDLVLTGKGTYQPIYSIDHHHTTKITTFLQIAFIPLATKLETQQQMNRLGSPYSSLEVSTKHMVFVKGKLNPVPAHQLKVDDQVQTITGHSKIIGIKSITRRGLYNPLTSDGTIIVNGGIVASTYSAFASNNEWVLDTGTDTDNNTDQFLLCLYKIGGRMSHQYFLNSVLRPYEYICTRFSLELCKTEKKEKVVVSEFAWKAYQNWMIYQDYWICRIVVMIVVGFIHAQNSMVWNNFSILLGIGIIVGIILTRVRRRGRSMKNNYIRQCDHIIK